MANTLYFGDNLHVLREHIKDESVDLIYLDPPFNSNRSYNVLFRSPSRLRSTAQAEAFEDTWRWGIEAELALDQVAERSIDTFRLLTALKSFLGSSDTMAYLAMMAVRLIEMRRVLKPTGSLYLHCDPTASHYLKVLLDGIFGSQFFRNEVVWRRTNAHNKTTRQFGPIHDILLYYARSNAATFHPGTTPYTKGYVNSEFRYDDERGRYRVNEIMGPGRRTGDSGRPWRGYDPTDKDRHWAIPGDLKSLIHAKGEGLTIQEQLDALYDLGCIVLSKSGRPKYKQYVGGGIPYQDIWAFQPGTDGALFEADGGIDQDVKWLDSEHERLGYPTQKPMGLLKRIIETSTNIGDVVLDPFCGCGTAIHTAEHLGRKWCGIDVTYLAIQIIEDRIKKYLPQAKYRIEGIPKDEFAARAMAERDPYQFQIWAVSRLGGQSGGKGGDRGIDGEIIFKTGLRDYGRAIVSVKGGRHVGPAMVRELRGTVEREKADMGVFVCLDDPTSEMRREAIVAGLTELPSGKVGKIQIVTAGDLIAGPDIGLKVTLTSVTAAAEAREEDRLQRKARPKKPEQLRREPEFKLPLKGGKSETKQGAFNLEEPVVSTNADTPKSRKKRA